MDNDKKKKPTKTGLIIYAAVTVVFAAAAVFARHLAVLFEGPILCIYVAVLPKYIFGLGAVLAILEGAVYASGLAEKPLILKTWLEGAQVFVVLIFILFIFPLSLREGMPRGNTYNLMRVVLVFMLGVFLWDFVKDLVAVRKSPLKGHGGFML